jgi:hypothetical protein
VRILNVRRRLTQVTVTVLAAGLASGAGWAVNAGADPGSSNTISNPSGDGATITSTTLTGQVTSGGGTVDSVDISVHWTDTVQGRPAAPHPPQQTAFNPGANVSVYPWSYAPHLGSNGKYKVDVTAVTSQSGTRMQNTVSDSFILDAPPARPVGLSDSVDTSHTTVTLTWVANTEDDLIGYEVLRAGPTASDP